MAVIFKVVYILPEGGKVCAIDGVKNAAQKRRCAKWEPAEPRPQGVRMSLRLTDDDEEGSRRELYRLRRNS